jgi:hypothetical protein
MNHAIGIDKNTIITGWATGSASFLMAFGATLDVIVAFPVGLCVGSICAFASSRQGVRSGLRRLIVPVEAEPLQAQSTPQRTRTYNNATPLIPAREEYMQPMQTRTMQRPQPLQAQRSQPLQRRAPVQRPTVDRNLAQQLTAEIDAINLTLRSLKINAGTKPALTVVGGNQMVFYTIKAAASQKISKIEACLPELSDAISTLRRKQTLVRMLRYPLRLEVEHPFYKPLRWDAAALDGKPNEVLVGKSYDDGPSNVRLAFSGNPHMLVAGTTGAGKSVLMNAMVLSLAWNTSPDDLVIYLIDMKNKSLAPLRALPHVKRFACDVEMAAGVVKMAGDALDAQIQNRNIADHRQHLLVIDEYADLSDDAETMKIINHIVRMGRDDAVNAIVGTQHPTSSVLGDDGTKQNFPVRIVGPVTDATAANVALGMRGTNAHLLPVERGAFLLRRGPELTRVNTYLLTPHDVAATVAQIRKKWGFRASTQSSTTTGENSRFTASTRVVEPVVEASSRSVVEDEPAYDEVAEMVNAMRPHYRAGISKNELCKRSFGKPFAGSSFCAKINEAIARLDTDQRPANSGDNKIIQMRRVV